jgi:hypothetical protein
MEINQRIIAPESASNMSIDDLGITIPKADICLTIAKLPPRLSRQEKIYYGKQPIKTKTIPKTSVLTLEDLLMCIPFSHSKPFVKFTIDNLRLTLESYHIKSSGSKTKLLNALLSAMDYPKHERRFLRGIIGIQRLFRLFLHDEFRRLIGPGLPVSTCLNDECPYTMEPLKEIPLNRLITWKEDAKKYGCEIYALLTDLKSKLGSPSMMRTLLRTSSGCEYTDLTPQEIRSRQRTLERWGFKNPFTRQSFSLEFLFRVYNYSCKILDKPIVLIQQTPTRPPAPAPRSEPTGELAEMIQNVFRRRGIALSVSEEALREYREMLTTQQESTDLIPESSRELPEERLIVSQPPPRILPDGIRLRLRIGREEITTPPTPPRTRMNPRDFHPLSYPSDPDIIRMPDFVNHRHSSVIEYHIPPEIRSELHIPELTGESGEVRHPFFLFYPIMMSPEYRDTFTRMTDVYSDAIRKATDIVSVMCDLGFYVDASSLTLPAQTLVPRDMSTSNSRNQFYGRWFHGFFEIWTMHLRQIHQATNLHILYDTNEEIIMYVSEKFQRGGIFDRLSQTFSELYRGGWYRSMRNLAIETRPIIRIIQFAYIQWIEFYDKLFTELMAESRNTTAMNLIIPMVRAGLLPVESFPWAVGL